MYNPYKMRIKIFIVTYNSAKYLNENVLTLVESNVVNYDYEINIINNHSNFHLDEYFLNNFNIKVLHNEARPDWSTGHLARNWNQCLINGFKDLSSPDCDILLHAQDDLTWVKRWPEFIIEAHKAYDFMSFGTGDGLCSYIPEAVLKLGLWDEKFSGIGCQESDYFLRALQYHRDRSSINDVGHVRILNPLDGNYGGAWSKGGNANVCNTPSHEDCKTDGLKRRDEHDRSKEHHGLARTVFASKWGVNKNGNPIMTPAGHVAWEVNWAHRHFNDREPVGPEDMIFSKPYVPPHIVPEERQDVFYPYFEKEIIRSQHPCYKLYKP